jgi:hypothetical protein
VFVPLSFLFYSLTLSAMGALVVFDVAGLLFKFTNLGHAAHLGGMAFGAWYVCACWYLHDTDQCWRVVFNFR